jgi:hypothetical protein
LIAVEAKLLRWRDALAQAAAYRRYADEVYVALPEGFGAPAIVSADLFRAAGVGLLIVSGNRLRQAVAATVSRDHDWRREFVYSRLTSCEGGPSANAKPLGRSQKGSPPQVHGRS